MFPKALDGAFVLFYTSHADYGNIYYTTGELAESVHYLAICKYEDSSEFYLFACNSNLEVVSDTSCRSIEECMRAAHDRYGSAVLWIKTK